MEEELFKAINVNNRKKVEELIADGVDINKRNEYGQTALMRAVHSYVNNLYIINTLINAGANVNLQNNNGSTALIKASILDNIDIVNALIKAGANVNLQNTDGNTALMSSAKSPLMVHGKSIIVVDALIKAGANVNLQNIDGNTALMLSLYQIFLRLKNLEYEENYHDEDVDEDEENYYVVDNTEDKKEAIIHFENLFKFLIENNANPYVKNNEGETIFDIAKENGNQEIINILTRVNNEKNIKELISKGANINSNIDFYPPYDGDFDPSLIEDDEEITTLVESMKKMKLDKDAGYGRRKKSIRKSRKKSRRKRKSGGRKKSRSKRKSVSRKYCLTTSPRKMGFSQKASCKAQGFLKRTSKKNKGRYIVSPKYKKRSRRRKSRRSKS